jgi:sulfoquinovosyltransferase
VVTTDADPAAPKSFLGFPITTLHGFSFPWYKHVRLSFDVTGRIRSILKVFKADVVHCSAPSIILFPAILWSRMFKVPLVVSYHTNLPGYTKLYVPHMPFLERLAYFLLKYCLKHADLILCTSPQLKFELEKLGLRRVSVWSKGINIEVS